MKRRKTIQGDEAFLRQKSTEVNFDEDNYFEWIKELQEYCLRDKVYALAPVQIGIPKRMIYLRNTTPDMEKNFDASYDESNVIINPVILRMEGHTQFLEACDSCLDFVDVFNRPYLVGVIDRPYLVEVMYYDIHKNLKKEVFAGFKATVIYHEFDHLNGVLHIDRTDDISHMNYEQIKHYRQENPYKIIRETGNFVYQDNN